MIRLFLIGGLLSAFVMFTPVLVKAETLGADAPEVQELIERARTALIDGKREVFVVVIAKMHFLMTGQPLEEKIDPATAPAEYIEGAARFRQVVDNLMGGVVLEKLRDDIRLLGLSAVFDGVGLKDYQKLAKQFENCAADPNDRGCIVGQEAMAWVEQARHMSAAQLRVAVASFELDQRPGVPWKTLSTIQALLLKQAQKLEQSGK